ncbi:hypothetical protein ABZ319_12365 [Nocardia sp. NPDC005978]|uniref:hypothetical protein n=1 Tax=Nocardia sp. NPDC005978 TaxID=3156725 RepID=UPI0033B078FC
MTTSGRPPSGKKIALPSGAVWEGGPTPGTSLITLPDEDPILVSEDGGIAPNAIVGRTGPFGTLTRAFEEVLGHVPSFFTNRMASEALNLLRGVTEPANTETETRILKISSKTTLLNPGKRSGKPGSGETIVEEILGQGNSASDAPIPIRRAYGGPIHREEQALLPGGMITGPGGSTEDKVLVAASPGEFVVNAAAADNVLPLLELLNSGWVPSAQFLTGMLNGVGSADPSATANPGQWRDMLGQGVVADALGSLGNAAIDAGAWAGSAVGSALSPLFAPGGPLAAQPGTGSAPSVQSPQSSTDSPMPLTASMQATPSGMLGTLAGFTGGAGGATGVDATELGSLGAALGSGVTSAATVAGGRVGAALGEVVSRMLGPAGEMAPKIGEQLGQLIGSRFGGELNTSMTLRAELGGQPGTSLGSSGGLGAGTTGGDGIPSVTDGTPVDTGSAPEPTSGDSGDPNSVVTSAGPSATTGGGTEDSSTARWQYIPPSADGSTNGGWAYLTPIPNVDRTGLPLDMQLSALIEDQPDTTRWVNGTKSLSSILGGNSAAQELKDERHRYNPSEGNFTDLVKLAANDWGTNVGNLLKPILGDQAPEALGNLAQSLLTPLGEAYSAADPDKNWTNTLGQWISNLTGVPWKPTGTGGSSTATQMTHDQQIGYNALTSAVSGLQQHGLLGGLTGAISGAASTAGSLVGGAIGTAIAPFLGPAAPLGPVIGQFLGSMAGGMLGGQLTRRIEWAGNAVKELVGTGFGLTDLADGPGGHTVRGDIYNFNGTDPKSASIAVERVRRRRAVAQQRGGGMGR